MLAMLPRNLSCIKGQLGGSMPTRWTSGHSVVWPWSYSQEHHPETYLFETRGVEKNKIRDWMPWTFMFRTQRMAEIGPEKLRLDYKDHPLLKDIKIHDDLISFLDACFTLEARERASASKLLSMGLMRGAERTPFTAIGPKLYFLTRPYKTSMHQPSNHPCHR